MRPHVLVMSDYYLPGFRAGGPIRTLSNIVECLGDEFSFSVITRDRDLGDTNPYPGIDNGFGYVGKAEVAYLPPNGLTLSEIGRRMNKAAPDIVYLNSFFSLSFSIIPLVIRRLSRLKQVPTILAPRGEFALSALEIKFLKKRCYLLCARLFGLCESLVWQASGEQEAGDIRREFPHAKIVVAPDLPSLFQKECPPKVTDKIPGRLRLVFLSRISRMKNLYGALQILGGIKAGEITFDIWGPIEDIPYWQECESILTKLPRNITAVYRGEVSPEQVHEVLGSYDVFFLPTLGENFGHVILEALGAGLPVVISDRTQWNNLATNCAGWDIPLDDIDRFIKVLTTCIDMDAREMAIWANAARSYADQICNAGELKEKTALLFLKCLHEKGSS